MKYQASRETIKLELGDGLWIEAKKEFTHGEARKVRAAMVSFGTNGEPQMKSSMEDAKPIWICTALVDWNLTDAEGTKLPITAEIVDDLTDEFIELITGKLGELYKQDDGKKNEL